MIRSCYGCTFGNEKINFGHTSAASGRSVRLLFGRPLYTLTQETLVDSGLAIKVCLYVESDHIPVHTEDKIFYSELDYHDFLMRRGWTCLREFDSFRHIDNLDDLRPDAIYRGLSMLRYREGGQLVLEEMVPRIEDDGKTD
ncbi:hypothetical protein RIF29_10036 [Crotalaria pallida]|uniref:GT-1/4-like C-terminal domain-containing protein n=1 Tax=Crotalaria pallida TaxID=3830 RepID=A0AAN9FSH8_CROPI